MTTFIGIAGGSGSGKSTFSQNLCETFGADCALISYDSYYRSWESVSLPDREQFNYDHPSALDADLLCTHLETLQKGRSVQVPVYCFSEHKRLKETETVKPTGILIVEGVLLFVEERIRSLFHRLIFVDASDSTRFQRRVHRDVLQRGRTRDSVLAQWQRSVLPMHQMYVEPSKQWADEIVSTESKPVDVDGIIKNLGISI